MSRLLLFVVVVFTVACSTSGDSTSDTTASFDAVTDGVAADFGKTDTYHYPKGCDITGNYWFELLQKVSGDCSPGAVFYKQVRIEKQGSEYRISAEALPLHKLEVSATLTSATCQLVGKGQEASKTGDSWEYWDVSVDWKFATITDTNGLPAGYGFTGTITLTPGCTITYACNGKWWGK